MPGRGSYAFGDISPDGRLLAVGMDKGARLWDLRSGRELAALPAGTPFVFFDGQAERRGRRRHRHTRYRAVEPPDERLGRAAALAGHERRSGGERLRLGPPRQLSPLSRAWFGAARTAARWGR